MASHGRSLARGWSGSLRRGFPGFALAQDVTDAGVLVRPTVRCVLVRRAVASLECGRGVGKREPSSFSMAAHGTPGRGRVLDARRGVWTVRGGLAVDGDQPR